jgi:hypothetical protein
VTPGDDAKLYSLIAQRFIETGGTPTDWGKYAQPDWYEERVHLLLPGFSSIVALFSVIFGFQIPAAVTIVTSLFRALTSATLYFMARTITGKMIPGLLVMVMYGLAFLEPPIGWFGWGGMAELASIFLLPVATTGTYVQSRLGFSRLRFAAWTGIVIAGMSLLHPFAFFYYVGFSLSLTALLFWRRRQANASATWLSTLVALGLVFGPAVRAFTAESSISGLYSSYNAGWTPVLGWSMSIGTAVSNVVTRAVIVYGLAGAILLIGGIILLRKSSTKPRGILGVLGGWAFLLFLLHENNPNGLFVVPFPLWYRIDSNRAFAVTSLSVAMIISLAFEPLARRTLGQFRHFAKLIARSKSLRPVEFPRLMILGAIFLLVCFQVTLNASLLSGARAATPVGPDDVAAFDWIRTKTTANATFFVNQADAGTWIPIYAQRRVVIPFGIVTNLTMLGDYALALRNFTLDPDSESSISFLRSVGATHIYAGPARIYGRAGFDPSRLIVSSLYQEEYHTGGVWIFRLVFAPMPGG